ncbi:uncharacterized protein K460DRAFT_396866 [Cucurbitaria berberidis CBS 394.84]|uniref:BTB domain-containing protein n=1 Tax=Cucurbitaria berberidis CBS 394.84 TaxID=1168544 RepID=A0A9P4GDI9_9PLEO|nr:uncharacterized protein K460DRAFT_396866 [Cucurbitaria berberidis CBS 394.84]KAF1843600.1 hypothetical protein K460DRAFT_396866 [Cucurbitaria berberidis CBS 394.84]
MEVLNFASPILQVKVGQGGDEQTFWVHQNILASRSEFFKRATNGKWLESDERLVTLPEDKPDIFSLYLNHLYTKRIPTKDFRILCQTYVLAEVLQDIQAKNCVIDALYARLEENKPERPRLGVKSVTELYSGTPAGSKARKFIVDYFADEGHESWLQKDESMYPTDFLVDLASSLFRKCPLAGWKHVPTLLQPASHYHEVIPSVPSTTEATPKTT